MLLVFTLSLVIENQSMLCAEWYHACQGSVESGVTPARAKVKVEGHNQMSCLMIKPTKWHVHPAKTQISLGIRPVQSESLLSAWRKLGSLATHWVHSEDSDQTGRMPRLIWVFAGHSHFVGFVMWWLKCISSALVHMIWSIYISEIYEPHHKKTCLQGLWPGKAQTGLLSYRD